MPAFRNMQNDPCFQMHFDDVALLQPYGKKTYHLRKVQMLIICRCRYSVISNIYTSSRSSDCPEYISNLWETLLMLSFLTHAPLGI